MAVYKLINQIQKYAWGSVRAIPELLGYENANNEPMAELWMGAHPKAPSLAEKTDGNPVPLNETTNGSIPFLFKVLASDKPLSIQAHPDLKQARAGYARENAAGKAFDAFDRNYKDHNHKPEIICALTEFHAMRGFRPAAGIAANFKEIMVPALESSVAGLETASESSSGIRNFFTDLMRLEAGQKQKLLKAALVKAQKSQLPASRWIKRFSELYPGDIGILSPLYLNLVILQPGEAMYIPAGELHAYLEGLGIELMANSDNVLRGGLTPKHVDVPELLATLSFEPSEPEILKPAKISDSESVYVTPAPEFYLSRIDLDGEYLLPEDERSPQLPSIFICLDGGLTMEDKASEGAGDYRVDLKRGDTAFVTPGSRIILNGGGLLYRASVRPKVIESLC